MFFFHEGYSILCGERHAQRSALDSSRLAEHNGLNDRAMRRIERRRGLQKIPAPNGKLRMRAAQ
jgi:hypothetical protein